MGPGLCEPGTAEVKGGLASRFPGCRSVGGGVPLSPPGSARGGRGPQVVHRAGEKDSGEMEEGTEGLRDCLAGDRRTEGFQGWGLKRRMCVRTRNFREDAARSPSPYPRCGRRRGRMPGGQAREFRETVVLALLNSCGKSVLLPANQSCGPSGVARSGPLTGPGFRAGAEPCGGICCVRPAAGV
jgi:hypothetical protein